MIFFLDFSYILSTTKIMNNTIYTLRDIYDMYLFILVKTDLDRYANVKYSYKRFPSMLGEGTENHLCFTKLYTKTL